MKDQKFSDLYLEPNGPAWFKRSPSDRQRNAIAADRLREVETLRRELQKHRTGADFRQEWMGVDFRVQRIETIQGDLYVCRWLEPSPIPFSELGYPEKLQDALLSDTIAKGLVLFTGGNGDGKSMSQASWLVERLTRFGGAACTIENPIEILLQGQYTNGRVVGTLYQTEVQSEADYGAAIHRLLRAAPDIIMLGEIRTKEAAAQALLASLSGRIVSATLHGNDVQTSLERLKNLVRGSGLDETLIGDSLSAVIHQSLSTVKFGASIRHSLHAEPLIVAGSTSETAIRNTLRRGEFAQLSSEVQRQKRVINHATDGGRI
ncbi:ATPase, T2SS/T4P/T4SS family [Burkholderia cenocepacia]|uniref:ATPase, T2SS/T4P/T4SS family n=1 Tax=Burkholderia cenocepacia TaxID=95486 RepID=UPI0013E0BBDE|nr:ATPase, T2SS/T4P/T4SS family [Burkholderia cenocepacia]MCW3587384.1 Flp pilus assembly complex ATPase component TadA [Burkholderia cenocepacia]MCW3632588.1 Flp pilus assembly complex ATPase component TadA [Burkholderia cenocepacia]MCW5181819.1 Flp pilus assembly complex ATPase component TadA [Burkholderia cenocepacia]